MVKLAVAVSCAWVVGCGGDFNTDDVSEVQSAVTQCGLPAPTVGVCEMAVCTVEVMWEIDDRPAGVSCNVTGHCDGAGTCIMPPPPVVDCDHPPAPRLWPGQDGHYPNGADVLTCWRPSTGIEIWHINYPSVDRATTDYPIIAWNPGDAITISATGCAQRQGLGSSWDRYVNPINDDWEPESMYYGTMYVTGVTGDQYQPLQHWIGEAFVAETADHLKLGYIDDNYSDNGYYDHDNGDNDQCVNAYGASVDVIVDHRPRAELTCQQWSAGGTATARSGVPELAQVATLLGQAEIPLGVPITTDSSSSGISHFQIFQGAPGQSSAQSNLPLNSAELHSDGCIYTAYTPVTAPAWYPTDLAFDSDPNHGWFMRPWDPFPDMFHPVGGNENFSTLRDNNRFPSNWLATNIPGSCGGAGSSWRTTPPRWIRTCAPNLPPSAWTPSNLAGFPSPDPVSSQVAYAGAICNWQIKQRPDTSDCIDSGRAEWSGVHGFTGEYMTAAGIVTNSFLSGGDFTHDHNDMAPGHFPGVHSDQLTHTDVPQCDGPLNAEHGDHCADWELNLLVDPEYRHLLARDESLLWSDGKGSSCLWVDGAEKYRLGNFAQDLRGALGIEGEQWYYPLGFRPEPGDRAVVRGSYIVDCGHQDWHTELHPASVMVSSYLQIADYSPVTGQTWNRPMRLTNNWRSITAGVPAATTKIILSPAHAETSVTVDVWPPSRPCVNARLRVAREYETPHPQWSGVGITEQLLPADNPNHVRITFTRNAYAQQWGGDGDLQNPDPNLTYFNAYMLWWDTSGVSCPAAGGPGSGGCYPNQGQACGSCGGTVQCNGSCSMSTPPNLGASCGLCGGHIQCDGTCSVATPPGTGAACGSCGGTMQCNGTCSIATPSNLGWGCGSCGGTVQCNGACSIATPADLNQSCGSCGGVTQCDGNCSVPTPWNLGAPCGYNGDGHIICGGTCQVYEP